MSASGYTGNPPGSGGGGGSTAWTDVTGKPSTFPPSPHNHVVADVTALQTALDAKAAQVHTHAVADVSGLQALLDGKAAQAHTHAISAVTGLQSTLDAKAPLASPALTGTPTAPTAAPGTNTTQVATTAYVTAAVAAGGGGGGGTAATFARDVVTTGDLVFAADLGAWAPVPGLVMPIAAVAGDDVEIILSGLLDRRADRLDFIELGVLVGGAIVRYASTNAGTAAAANEGDPSIYPGDSSRFSGINLSMSLNVQAGDLSGGNVTFAVAHRGPGGGKLFASANYPLRWRVRNDH